MKLEISLPAPFLMSFHATGKRLTGNDVSIWLTALSHAPDLAHATVQDAEEEIAAAADGSLTYTSIDVSRPEFYDIKGNLNLKRFRDAIGRLTESTVQIAATQSEAFLPGVPMLGGHGMRDSAATGANAIEVFYVHPWIAAWSGKGADRVAQLYTRDLAKLTSRYSVMMYCRYRAARAGATCEDLEIEDMSSVGRRMIIPVYRAHEFFGFDLTYAESQIRQKVFSVVESEFKELGLEAKIDFMRPRTGKKEKGTDVSVTIVPKTVDRAMRDMDMDAKAHRIWTELQQRLEAGRETP